MTALPPAAVTSASPWTRRLQRATAALLVATVAVDVAFLVGLIVSGGENPPVVTIGLSLASQWVPVSLFWVVAVRTRFAGIPVMLTAAGVTLSAVGDSYYALAMDAEGYLPFPSPADVGYLLFYPLLVAALVALVPRQSRRIGALVLIETAVATLGAAAVLTVVLAPVLDAALAGDSVVGSAIAAAYPLFDILIIAVIVGIASLPVAVGQRWGALIAGLGVFAAADIAYALLESQGAYAGGTPLDATWAFGLALIAWWAAGMADPSPPNRAPRTQTATLPTLAAAAGLTVLVIGSFANVPALAIVLAALSVGFAAVPIAFRQVTLARMVAAQEAAVRRLTELDREKSDLLATVNHEFRTPLTSITGHVELLLDGAGGDLPKPATEMLQTVERNAARLQHLIDEAFAATRPSADAEDAARIPLGDLVTDVVEQVGETAAAGGVELVARVDDPQPSVTAHRDRLAEAVAHVVGNAVKFSSPGGRVEVSVAASDGAAILTVSDDGIGIPEQERDLLFAQFFRASNARSAAIPGVGLGLATARRIVAAHGGEIVIESEIDRGTEVTVRLPAD